jgi:hypothetical protein
MAAPAVAHERKGTDGANPKTKLDIRSYSVAHQQTISYAQTTVTITGTITTARRFGNKVLKKGYLAMKFHVGDQVYQARISRGASGFKGNLVQLAASGKVPVGAITTWRDSPKRMKFSFPKTLIGTTTFRFSALSSWAGCGCKDKTAWVGHR